MNLSNEYSTISLRERESRFGHKSGVFWLTGLSGSGKSTLAKGLERALFDQGINAFILDGDNVRQGLCANLDFSPSGRDENLRRVAEVAKLFNAVGILVISAFISPLESQRLNAQKIVGEADFHEVFVDCPLELCEKRDPKGFYKKARLGEIKEFTGVSSPFEAPSHPALHLKTSGQSIEQSLAELTKFVLSKVRPVQNP